MIDIKYLRTEKGVSQKTVADYLGITQQAYANYENGKRQPDQETLAKLADFFNVTSDYLIGRVSTPQNRREPTDDDIMFALFGGDQDVTEEDYEAVKAFASYIRDKRAKKTSGNNPDVKKD